MIGSDMTPLPPVPTKPPRKKRFKKFGRQFKKFGRQFKKSGRRFRKGGRRLMSERRLGSAREEMSYSVARGKFHRVTQRKGLRIAFSRN